MAVLKGNKKFIDPIEDDPSTLQDVGTSSTTETVFSKAAIKTKEEPVDYRISEVFKVQYMCVRLSVEPKSLGNVAYQLSKNK